MKRVITSVGLLLCVLGGAFGDGPGFTNAMVTGDEWQKLNVAKQAALKANPALAAKAQELAAKMDSFQEKLRAALIKEDPKNAATMELIKRLGLRIQ